MTILGSVYAGLMQALIDMGVGSEDAASTASTVCEWVAREEGGARHFLPRPSRTAGITEALAAGKRPEQVAKEHGCSIRTAYRALAKVRRSMGSPTWDLQVDAAQARRSSEG